MLLSKQKNIILVSVLIISLVVFYSPVLPVLAEPSSAEAMEGEGEETPPVETPSDNPSDAPPDSSGTDISSQGEEPAQLTEDSPPSDDSGTDINSSPSTENQEEQTEQTTGDNSVPEESSTTEGEEQVIETGDAEAVVEVENTVNTNVVNGEENITGIENDVSEECDTCQEQVDSISEEVINDNQAEVENNIEQEGLTGENQIGTEETPNLENSIIRTGNINIFVGLINTVNTNIIGSTLSQILFNIFKNLEGDIDLSDEIASPSENECLENICYDVADSNEGEIDNEVVIEGSSGDNSINTENGDAMIETGNINAAVSIFNTLNTNILGSNWIRLIINIFGNWVGDLVLPGKEAMEEFMEHQSPVCEGPCDGTNIVNSNEGEIENEVLINADTGQNAASGDSAEINTGNANVGANILNLANSNITNSNLFFIAINNFGSWQGNIFSLPPGFGISGDFDGVRIFNSGPNGTDGSTNGNSFDVVNDNSGSIKNGVVMNLFTGNNSAQSPDGSASINTGNINAFIDLTNILNSNVTGSNWLLGAINVFGSWQGDLAFGRPDLWIGESVEMENNPAEVDERITYTLTYYNAGDADATGVVLTDDFDENSIGISDPGSGVVFNNPGEIQWDLGTIPPGGYGAVSYTAVVLPDIPFGISQISNQAVIDSFEDDGNEQDNTENFSINAIKRYVQPNPVLVYPAPPQLEIKKSSNVVDFVYPGSIVDYVLEITNNSNSQAYRVVVTDVLINDLPEPIYTNAWNLDYVFPHEKIVISYQVYIGEEVPPGLYTNYAQANGYYIWGEAIGSNEASLTIEVKAPPVVENVEEEVASATSDVASATPEETDEEVGNVGIGEEVALAEVEEPETEEPEVLGVAKTSGSRIRVLPYFGFEFDDWIYILLLVILVSVAVLFVVLYVNDLRKAK
ncbi:MAG: hypothetical protein ACOZAL_03770 [Patescibacteria group bacterium]